MHRGFDVILLRYANEIIDKLLIDEEAVNERYPARAQ